MPSVRMTDMIRIILADDHAIVRHGLKQLMALTPDVRVVGEAASGQQVLALVGGGACDLLLLDLTMPGLSGVELIKRISVRPDAPQVLVLSMHNEAQLV